MTTATRKPDFTDTIRIMSHDSVLDFAEGKGWKAAVAKTELRNRVRHGLVDDLDFLRAREILNLA